MYETINEWLGFLLRWIHLIAGISWIGNSFYFMWMDASFEPLQKTEPGVDGELYMVHGGHFYHVEKQKMRPGFIPKTLHWFKWEATLTWLSGFILLTVLYYFTNGVYLVSPGSLIQNPVHAVFASLALIFGVWFAYDLFWISSFAEKHKTLATAISLLSVGALSFGLCQLFTGRGAFLHLGAIFATLMVLNVWIRILPGQRRMFEAAKNGQVPDYTSGTKAKWRSTHNSYMTLPVLFSMLSNHFPLAYGHSLNWVLLILIAILGGVVRHMMIQWNVGKTGAKFLIPIGLLVALLIFLSAGNGKFWVSKIPGEPVPFAQVRAIIDQRCVACHSQHPSEKMFIAPPNGITFEDSTTIQRLASRIHERVWVTRTMPFINKTGMTDDERALVGRWVEGGAKLE